MANNAGHFEALDACHLDIAQHIQALGTLAQHIEDHGIDDHARHEAHSIEFLLLLLLTDYLGLDKVLFLPMPLLLFVR